MNTIEVAIQMKTFKEEAKLNKFLLIFRNSSTYDDYQKYYWTKHKSMIRLTAIIGTLIWVYFTLSIGETVLTTTTFSPLQLSKILYTFFIIMSILLSRARFYYKIFSYHISIAITVGACIVMWMEKESIHSSDFYYLYNMAIRIMFYTASALRVLFLPQLLSTITIMLIHCALFPSLFYIIRVILCGLAAILGSYVLNYFAVNNFVLVKLST